MLRRTREAVLSGIAFSGVGAAVARSRWRQQRLLIWCFHGVSIRDEHEWNPALYLSPSALRRRLELFTRERCHVLPFGEAVLRLREGSLPPRSVAVTVDDGGYDFYCRAVPLFQEFGVPAITYLSSYHSRNQIPIFGLGAGYLLWSVRHRTMAAWPEVGLAGAEDLADPAARARVVVGLLRHADSLRMGGTEKNVLLQELAARVGADYELLIRERLLHLMRPDELHHASRAGFGVELHTHRHRMPPDPEEFRTELRDNRRAIEEATGIRPRHFCYPSGQYHARYLPILREEGIETATTCDVALATRSSSPLLLPRFVDTTAKSESVLRAWLSGVATWAYRMPRFDPAAYETV